MKTWWDRLSVRERLLVAGGTALTLALLLYALVWQPLQAGSRRLRHSVTEQRAELAWMRQAAAEIKRLENANSTRPASDGRSLLTLVDQTARTAGLGSSLKRVAPQGDDKLSAQLDLVEFDPFIVWLGALERNHRLTIVNLSVDRTAAAGRVNARVILQGSRP
ncbi:type II secretion system protein GspM [Candidatus Contendibacter odensensis]|uniref:Type II secretion system protein M n=1 Tax=Candidatus Contendobacter odensis Run_B_J11 TaxID=1400861 RepID=A0A7U7G7V0_9GAMM|nr:type II secretion system protein M [Candidatus Contendobacter odensis]MBK8750444.1 type II secretion system protein M [Candidatus Competibacteraceae bacterium]CDH43459.1 putative General secretion pathway M protein [Candidatus Contendobacter odensis Run_B_J11]